MSKTRKLQDYAEDINPSQSDEMEVLPQGDGTPSEIAKAVKQLSASAETIHKHADTLFLKNLRQCRRGILCRPDGLAVGAIGEDQGDSVIFGLIHIVDAT